MFSPSALQRNHSLTDCHVSPPCRRRRCRCNSAKMHWLKRFHRRCRPSFPPRVDPVRFASLLRPPSPSSFPLPFLPPFPSISPTLHNTQCSSLPPPGCPMQMDFVYSEQHAAEAFYSLINLSGRKYPFVRNGTWRTKRREGARWHE